MIRAKREIPHELAERIHDHALVLFDGECGFCRFWVRYIIDRDPQRYFLFAPLQSEVASALLEPVTEDKPLSTCDYETVVLFDRGETHSHSEAALRIAAQLTFPTKLLAIFRIIPRFARDAAYRFIAKRRHTVFKTGTCDLAKPEDRQRFLDRITLAQSGLD